jgi:hypothetical protein
MTFTFKLFIQGDKVKPISPHIDWGKEKQYGTYTYHRSDYTNNRRCWEQAPY